MTSCFDWPPPPKCPRNDSEMAPKGPEMTPKGPGRSRKVSKGLDRTQKGRQIVPKGPERFRKGT